MGFFGLIGIFVSGAFGLMEANLSQQSDPPSSACITYAKEIGEGLNAGISLETLEKMDDPIEDQCGEYHDIARDIADKGN